MKLGISIDVHSEVGILVIQDHQKFLILLRQSLLILYMTITDVAVFRIKAVSLKNTSLRRAPPGRRGLLDPSRSGRAVAEPQSDL